MGAPRDTSKYNFFSESHELLHCRRTRDLHRREGEHQRAFGEPNGYIEQVGRSTTWEAAGRWEMEQRCSPYQGSPDDAAADDDDGLGLAVTALVVLGVGGLVAWAARR